MRFTLLGLIFSIIVSPLVEAINPAIYTPHTQYRKIQHSRSDKVIQVSTKEKFVRKVPRSILRLTHTLNSKQRSYEVIDVTFVDGQRVGTKGIRQLATDVTDTGAELPVFGNDYGKRRDTNILTSRERRSIIIGDGRNPALKRKTNAEKEESTAENTLWYGTTFKTRYPAKPSSGEDPEPVKAKPVTPEGAALGGKFPSTATMEISAINKTQGYVDATTVDAKEGDVFKFTVDFISKETGVSDFSAMVDITNILDRVHLTDIDRGYQEGNYVVFNKFSLKAPIKRTYEFTASLHKCKEEQRFLTVVAQQSAVNIPTSCQ